MKTIIILLSKKCCTYIIKIVLWIKLLEIYFISVAVSKKQFIKYAVLYKNFRTVKNNQTIIMLNTIWREQNNRAILTLVIIFRYEILQNLNETQYICLQFIVLLLILTNAARRNCLYISIWKRNSSSYKERLQNLIWRLDLYSTINIIW